MRILFKKDLVCFFFKPYDFQKLEFGLFINKTIPINIDIFYILKGPMNYRPFNGFSHAAKLLRPLTTPLVLLIFQLTLSQQHNRPQPISIIDNLKAISRKKSFHQDTQIEDPD